ncbi:unnamed protein product [Brachionus calyciflorus]|uniref:Uncharacterized protein n=1 Tax=Brachionus calyciflorus TaxID=104777 RepID=A0A813N9L9_9BILA|nr:unnamed protein product [Brachionus calyciflorus]
MFRLISEQHNANLSNTIFQQQQQIKIVKQPSRPRSNTNFFFKFQFKYNDQCHQMRALKTIMYMSNWDKAALRRSIVRKSSLVSRRLPSR